MMTKQEVIKEAYGDEYENRKPDQNGWSNCYIYSDDFTHSWDYSDIRKVQHEFCRIAFLCRPKSLKGIEKNNGWITIETDNNFPKKDIDCHFIKGKLIYNGLWDNKLKRFYSGDKWISNVFQYRIIKTPKPPLHK